MAYTIDNQTYTDLNLTGRYKTNSIFSLFNHTETKGASSMMEKAFTNPYTDAKDINSARDLFIAFGELATVVPISQQDVEDVEAYIGLSSASTTAVSLIEAVRSRLAGIIFSDQTFKSSVEGIKQVQKYLKKINNFVIAAKTAVPVGEMSDKVSVIVDFLSEARIKSFIDASIGGEMSLMKVAEFNTLLRNNYRKELVLSLRLMEEMDFLITVANIGKKHGLVYADALSDSKMTFEIDNMRHPRVPGAVGNDIRMYHDKNLIFLTGANMAGKSTLMKSFGISLYLAHLGFPLAADKMTFTPMDGMFTSINVPDDITQGYSHFYAEVMRVKGVALEVAKKLRLLIIFDELFKGTNVKDAYDGTAAITRSFSKCDKSMFIISTHIMEVGEMLKKECKNVQFKYLPTLLVDGRPKYTYKLTDGIADDRYGMRIINNERIIQIIRGE